MLTKRISLTAVLAVLIVALAPLATGCATNRGADEQITDAGITARVKSKLAADPEVNPFNIDVDTIDGVVRLSGVVEDPEARTQAGELARRTDGVRQVKNEIQVGSRSAGERLGDGAISSKVKAKLTADPELNPLNIDVDTVDGVVTLSGYVQGDLQRQEAERLARNTKGVREVRNQLEVRGTS